MGLGRLLTRNITYDVTNTVTGETASHTIFTDGGPGMYPGWSIGQNYRGGMGIPAAWRLAHMISNQIGRIPWHAYREVAGRPPVKILPRPPILERPAGPLDTGLGSYRSWALDRMWHGNAIGIVSETNAQGWPTAALPVNAEFVQVKMVGANDPAPGFQLGEIAYLINGRWYHQSEVIHFKGPCKPGDLRGMGILEEHFASMERSRKLDEAASAVDSSAVPTGVLKSLNPDLDEEEAAALKESWQVSQRRRTVAVLNPLTDFQPIAWNPTEAQLLEARQYTLVEWANIFGVAVTYAGGQNASRVYTNIVEQGLELLRFGAVGDMIAEFEATLTTLLPRGNYVKGNVDHLLRADTKGRYEAHAIALASKFLTVDEVREMEERPALTPEQKAELNPAPPTPAPAVSNQAGTGRTPPRLAAVRAELDDDEEPEPDYDGPDTDVGRDFLDDQEAQAWAADDAAGELRAAGTGGQLKRYWTAGPGLAKWRGAAHPWRTLRRYLSKYLSGEKLDSTTSSWYRTVFGYLPQDKPGRRPRRRRR